MQIHARVFTALLATVGASCVSSPILAVGPDDRPPVSRGYEWVSVAGTGVHYFSTAIVHSTEPTDTGVVQRSTETVELSGDLDGRILYQPVSVFDFVAGTLVNTGHQVFSGTVLGSAPVLLHDDEFRFDVDLNTGATTGKVWLSDRIAGPRIQCNLDILGTGLDPDGNSTVAYSGQCKIRRGSAAGL
jgi:hypothetical protein